MIKIEMTERQLGEGVSVEVLNRTIDGLMFDIDKIGEECLTQIKENIQSAKARPDGSISNLAGAMNLEMFDEGGWGVGNIEYLDKQAPYWEFVNYGVSGMGMTIPGRGKMTYKGAFYPGLPQPTPGLFETGRWTWWRTGVDGQMHTLTAHRGIRRPLNYIGKTWNWLDNRLQDVNFDSSKGDFGGERSARTLRSWYDK